MFVFPRKAFRKGKFHKELAKKSRKSHVYESYGRDTGVHLFNAYHPNVGDLEGFTIIHLSDLHCGAETGDYSNYHAIARFIADAIVMTGDVVNMSYSELTEGHKRLLESFSARYGKFYVSGNHEQWGAEQDLDHYLLDIGFVKIEGKTLSNGRFSVAGLPYVHPKKGFAPKQAEFNPDTFNILLTHSLDELTADAERNIDLVLSGHLHAGEFALGPINGSLKYTIPKEFLNSNKQVGVPGQEFSFLDGRCLSYNHPGMINQMRNRFGLPRIGTYKPGIVVHTLKNPEKK